MAIQKSGSPFLYDEATGDVVGIKDMDGGETILVTAQTDPLTGGIGISVAGSGVGGLPAPVSTDAAANRTLIQSILESSGHVVIQGRGNVYVDDTLILPSQSRIDLAPGCRLMQSGTTRKAVLRSGNAEFAGELNIDGLIVLCARQGGAAGVGTIRYTKSGATRTLEWMAPGDSSYGAAVDISGASDKAALVSANGDVLYVRWSTESTYLPASDGVRTQQVRVLSRSGARTLSMTRSSGVIAVTEVGHPMRVGDLFHVLGNADFNGTFRIRNATATTYEAVDARADASGSADVYSIHDISLDWRAGAGVISGSGTVKSRIHAHAMIFFMVNGLRLNGYFKVIEGAGAKYAGYFNGVHRVRGDGIEFDRTASDGFTTCGVAYDVEWRNVSGASLSDNIHGIGTSNNDSQLMIHPDEAGVHDVDNYRIDGIDVLGTGMDVVRLFGGPGKIKNVKVKRMRGSVANGASAIWVFHDGMVVGGTVCTVEDFEVNGLNVTGPAGTGFVPLKFDGASLTTDRVRLRNVAWDADNNGDSSNDHFGLLTLLNGTHSRIDVRDSRVKTAGAGKLAYLVKGYKGSVGTLNIEDSATDNATAMVKLDSTMTAFTRLIYRGCDTVNTLYLLSGGFLPDVVEYGATRMGSGANRAISSGSTQSKVVTIRADITPVSLSTRVDFTAAGPTANLNGAWMDITKAARVDGALCYNTNATADNGTDGACGLGLFACIGTASGSWKRVGTTGGAGNQY